MNEETIKRDGRQRVALSDAKKKLLNHWIRIDFVSERGSAAQWPTIKSCPEETEAPLSFGQERLWFLDQLNSDGSSGELFTLCLNGRLEKDVLKKCFMEIVRRHSALRTCFTVIDGEPKQRLVADCSVDIKEIDLRQYREGERGDKLRELLYCEGQKLFNLARGPLIRITLFERAIDDYILMLNIHHIVSDGWSMGVLLRELSALYNAFSSGESSPLPALLIQYKDYARWQKDHRKIFESEAGLRYWTNKLSGELPVLNLPTDYHRKEISKSHGKKRYFNLSSSFYRAVEDLCRREQVTEFMVLLAGFKALLHRYTFQKDIIVGSPVANRRHVEVEPLIGIFMNPLPFRSNLSGEFTFKDLLKQIREVALEVFDHQDVPFNSLVKHLKPERDPKYMPVYQVMFVFQNFSYSSIELTGMKVNYNQEADNASTMGMDMILTMWKSDHLFEGTLEYRSDLFRDDSITRFLKHFSLLLECAVTMPEQRISDLPLLNGTERHKLLVDWNDTTVEFSKDKCIHELFEAQTERTPENVAVIFEGNQLNYRELNSKANQLANQLRRLGVGPETLVGILMERSLDLIISVLGVLKAGGAYLPLDPMYPQDRLNFMLADSKAKILITQEGLAHGLTVNHIRTVRIDNDKEVIAKENDENPVNIAKPDNLAYVIYTSGSTGIPKGVMIENRSLVNYVEAACVEFDLSSDDRVLQFASLSFDAAAEEIFPCLVRGAALVLRTDRILTSTSAFIEACRNNGLTVLDLPTAFWHQLVDDLARTRLTLPESLRLVIIGGERALPERLKTWQEHVGQRIKLLNTYGPTEATIVATICDLGGVISNDICQEVPIGRPTRNIRVYVLDEYRQPVPVGVDGEIYIGGVGVARGYLNRPDLTADRFIPDPFCGEPDAKLYRTGDLARYLSDGNIEFLGRIDDQVKIRGFRVELGEVETVLRQYPDVRDAFVTTEEYTPGIKRLIAYLVFEAECSLDITELRNFLKGRLPDYMVPSIYARLDKVPLTPNGKVDRRALPTPDNLRPELEVVYVAPRNELEHGIASIWQDVLNLEKVGIHDNFFELGGHSLLTIQLHSRLRDKLEINFPLRSLFEVTTIAEQGQLIETLRLTLQKREHVGTCNLKSRQEIEI